MREATNSWGIAEKKSQYPFHRRYLRHAVRVSIEVCDADCHDTWTQNLSLDGVCFDMPRRIAEGESVMIWVYLREKQPSQPMFLRCHIVWNEETEHGTFRHGGEFLSFADEDRQRLRNYLDQA